MQFNKLSWFFLIAALFVSVVATAQVETGTHPDAKEWYKRTQKLKAIETRIKEQNKTLQGLIKNKNNGQKIVKQEKGEHLDILEVIVTQHRELAKSHAEYDAERKEIKYRYPGGADLVERRYLPLRAPTIEQLEKEMGLDGELSLLRKKIDTKYASFVKRPPDHPDRNDGPEATLQDTSKKKKRKKLKLVK